MNLLFPMSLEMLDFWKSFTLHSNCKSNVVSFCKVHLFSAKHVAFFIKSFEGFQFQLSSHSFLCSSLQNGRQMIDLTMGQISAMVLVMKIDAKVQIDSLCGVIFHCHCLFFPSFIVSHFS